MNTDNFFAFIDYVYAFNGHKRTVDALCNGTIRFGRWAEIMSNKRRKFESCAFTCYAENPNFQKQLPIYYNKLKKTIEGYNKSHWFDNEYDIKIDKRKFLEQKYHEVRRREIINAFNYLHQLMNGESINSNSQNQIEDKDVIKAFSNRYSDEQLQGIFNYLKENTYLHSDTDFSDFKYYFSGGKGELPKNHLKWCRNYTELALFISNTFPNEDMIWEKTKKIFSIDSNFATLANRGSKSDTDKNFRKIIDEIKKKKND